MINPSHVQSASDAIDDIAEDGRLVSFGHKAPAATAYGPAGDYVEDVQIHVLQVSGDHNFSNDVRNDDLFFLVGAENDLTQYTHMIDSKYAPLIPLGVWRAGVDAFSGETTEYSIEHIKPLVPGEVVILYKIQVRA